MPWHSFEEQRNKVNVEKTNSEPLLPFPSVSQGSVESWLSWVAASPWRCSEAREECVNCWGIPALPGSGWQGQKRWRCHAVSRDSGCASAVCLLRRDVQVWKPLPGEGVCCLPSGWGVFPWARLEPVFGTSLSLSRRRRWERQRVSSLLLRAGTALGNRAAAPGDSYQWEKAWGVARSLVKPCMLPRH